MKFLHIFLSNSMKVFVYKWTPFGYEFEQPMSVEDIYENIKVVILKTRDQLIMVWPDRYLQARGPGCELSVHRIPGDQARGDQVKMTRLMDQVVDSQVINTYVTDYSTLIHIEF